MEPVIKNKTDDAIWELFLALIIKPSVRGRIDIRNNKSKRI